MRIPFFWAVLGLSSGCLQHRPSGGHCDRGDRGTHCDDEDEGLGDDDDFEEEGDDDDAVRDGDDTPEPEQDDFCSGFDPLPERVVLEVSGTVLDGQTGDQTSAQGTLAIDLVAGDFQYDAVAEISVRNELGQTVAGCTGTGSASCTGEISGDLCDGGGFFSYSIDGGLGSWSYFDPEVGTSGGGDLRSSRGEDP